MQTFHEKLKGKIDEFIHLVYDITKTFPKEELYGATSQLRQASLSVALNYYRGIYQEERIGNDQFF